MAGAANKKRAQLTYATAPAPSAGMMYDAFGVQVPIPAEGYRNIGYVHALTGDTAMEMSLNPASTVVTTSGGAVTSFNAPSFEGAAVASTNQVNIGIGTATLMDFGTDPVSGMSWGRWQGGQINRVSLATGQVSAVSQGAGSTHWFATPTQTQAIVLPLTGIIPYTLVGGTSPTDTSGTIGKLNSATFTANFTNATVDIGLNLSMPATKLPAVTIDASAFGIPILPGANFKTASPTINCPACTGVTSGTIGGQFSGPGGAGVGVGYGFKNDTQIINGAAVFRK
ncbi:MAG: hypothetical protein PHQ05_08590 [Sterolibacterium sp.]|nr:hypothetical protein [Sterolibacterium sp.]